MSRSLSVTGRATGLPSHIERRSINKASVSVFFQLPDRTVLKKCRPRKQGKGEEVTSSCRSGCRRASECTCRYPPGSSSKRTCQQTPYNAQPRPADHPMRAVIGRATSRGNLRLVVQPVVAICDWSYNQS